MNTLITVIVFGVLGGIIGTLLISTAVFILASLIALLRFAYYKIEDFFEEHM